MKNYEKIEEVKFIGHGHYKVTVSYYGKSISHVITDMTLIDDYKSDERGWKTAGNHMYKLVVLNYKKA